MSPEPVAPNPPPTRKPYVRAVGPRLRVLLAGVFTLTALLGANSAYLTSISILEWLRGLNYQNYFYQWMFLAHLVLGLLLVVPFVVFALVHLSNARGRPNRRAVRMGYTLFAAGLAVLLTGVLLMRLGVFAIKDPRVRSPLFWIHVASPLAVIWLYVLHRLAGPRIRWRVGASWAGAVLAMSAATVVLHSHDPRRSSVAGPVEGEAYFSPSLARTATGKFIPAGALMLDTYCQKCHPDTYNDWFHSAHHFSSFNNPPYLFSVRETRRVSLQRDGTVRASRWCAGCHDVVPFFSGAFDNPHFDDVRDPTAGAGITCVACHSITHVNSTRGNADYTIEEPPLYPFTNSKNPILEYINETLVKANPSFHKKTFLKPLHTTAEFCSTCHKVSIPVELTRYKDFLRGQDHYDAYLLSGVSGHGARSFYYPQAAKLSCAACHMPLTPSQDFGARYNELAAGTAALTIHNHMFPAADTGLAAILGDPVLLQADAGFLKGCARVDIFGVRDGGTVDSPLAAPLRPAMPALVAGRTYLLEVVIRTLTVGHTLTQGTADSNELWLDAQVTAGGRTLGRSGGLGPHREVDPWAHFVNIYMLDRDGNRIDRRNAQDIYTPLYNHQIPPGAGQVVHYAFTVPPDAAGPIRVDVALRYRKFDTTYMNYVSGNGYARGQPYVVANELPIVTIAADTVVFAVEGAGAPAPANPPSPIIPWQRWNDYGIGLLLEGNRGSDKGELVQAADAFAHVEALGQPDGPLNLARVYFKEGRVGDMIAALGRAARFNPPPPRWTLEWLSGLAAKATGDLDGAVADFRAIVTDRYPELDHRGFDFSLDYELVGELGQTLVERAKQEHGSRAQDTYLREAEREFRDVLAIDSENATAYYNLALVQRELGRGAEAERNQLLYERYRVDDNAGDRAVAIARGADKAADHAAEAIVIYPLQRPGAPGTFGSK